MSIYLIGFATLINSRLSGKNNFPRTDILMTKISFCQDSILWKPFLFGLLKVLGVGQPLNFMKISWQRLSFWVKKSSTLRKV